MPVCPLRHLLRREVHGEKAADDEEDADHEDDLLPEGAQQVKVQKVGHVGGVLAKGRNRQCHGDVEVAEGMANAHDGNEDGLEAVNESKIIFIGGFFAPLRYKERLKIAHQIKVGKVLSNSGQKGKVGNPAVEIFKVDERSKEG